MGIVFVARYARWKGGKAETGNSHKLNRCQPWLVEIFKKVALDWIHWPESKSTRDVHAKAHAKYKLHAYHKMAIEQRPTSSPMASSTVLAVFRSADSVDASTSGDAAPTGPTLTLPTNVTPEQLEMLLNQLLGNVRVLR